MSKLECLTLFLWFLLIPYIHFGIKWAVHLPNEEKGTK